MARETRARYTVTIDFYIWAEDDRAAVKEALKRVRQMEKAEDNQPRLLEVHSTPFASFDIKQIYDRKTNQFDISIDEVEEAVENEE